MPRHARIVIPGAAHHITQRGNNRQTVFRDDQDRELYVRLLRHRSRRHGVEILAWCLMTNHVHLVLVPQDARGLSKVVGETHWIHAQAFNKRHARVGHLWHGRYFSTPMDELHTLRCMLYVERNPVRAGLVQRSEDHLWSSARAHVKGDDARRMVDAVAWRRRFPPEVWRAMLREGEDEVVQERIESGLRSGIPLMDEGRIAVLETRIGRCLKRRPRGRPRKDGSPPR